jgi:hypothetical protein
MTETSSWQAFFDSEIQQAEAVRAAGNEGKARVCARRAAGAAAGAYLASRGETLRSPSAYEQLRRLCELSDTPSAARQAAENLLVRVTPEYTLPIAADLLDEARRLRQELFPYSGA